MPTAPTEPETAVIEPSSAPSEAMAGAGAPRGATRPHLRERRPAASGAPPAGARGSWQRTLSARALAWWPTVLIAGRALLRRVRGGRRAEPQRHDDGGDRAELGSGLIVAAVAVFGPARERAYGGWAVGLLLAFAALTALSVVWSVQPDDSFKDAGRMLAYCGVFAAAVALARAVPAHWPAVLGGIVLAASVVCVYALLTKVFPASLDAGDVYARLRAPYSYWNAIGLTAAMGAIGCMWLGARRTGHALLSALAYPAMGLMLLTLMLAYSRGALVALVLGLALWFCIVPLRLRGAAILISGAVCAGGVIAWDFSRHALNSDNVALAQRTSAGHQLGVLIVAMLVLLSADRPGVRLLDWAQRPFDRQPAARGHDAAQPARGRRARLRGCAGGQPPRLHGHDLTHAALAHRSARTGSVERPGPPDGGGQRARALLERGAEGLPGASGARRGRGRLRDGATALPHGDARRAPRARLHRADAGRPRPRRAWPDARAAARVDGRGGARDAPVQPPLEQLEHTARLARSRRQRRHAGLAAADQRRRASGAVYDRSAWAC